METNHTVTGPRQGTPNGALTVRAETRPNLDRELDDATARLLERALIRRDRGILVTRHSPTQYSLELHQDVPFGVTLELDAWHAQPSSKELARPSKCPTR